MARRGLELWLALQVDPSLGVSDLEMLMKPAIAKKPRRLTAIDMLLSVC